MDCSSQYFEVINPAPGTQLQETDMVLLMLLKGQMHIRYQETSLRLKPQDVILINPGMSMEIIAAADALCAKAVFSLPFLARSLKRQNIIFSCNSISDETRSYQDLREILAELTAEYTAARNTDLIIDSLLLRLLDTLSEHYQVDLTRPAQEEKFADDRMREIMQYIVANLDREISLSDLAESMYLSKSTVSRIFKKSTGVYFADYVAQLRVKSALVMLEQTHQPLTQIALACGFSNAATFSRAFQQQMKMSPSEYRNSQSALADQAIKHRAEESARIRSELRESGFDRADQIITENISLDLDALKEEKYHKIWNRMINIGSLHELTKANVQVHAQMLKDRLKYKYVRVWNVFSNQLMITDGKPGSPLNFRFVDEALDFCVQNGLRPFIDFGNRPNIVVRTVGEEVFLEEDYIVFPTREDWERAISAFLKHIVSRYGQEEVVGWIYELTDSIINEDGSYNLYRDAKYSFFRAYLYLYREIRWRIPGATYGGIGGIMAIDCGEAETFFARCVKEDCVPDFVSFTLFPVDDAKFYVQRFGREPAADEMSESAQIERIHEAMVSSGLKERGARLFITEWNPSISNRNYLNDSCFRASYLVDRIRIIWDQAELIGIMSASDWISSYYDTSELLHGGVGLLTKDGIRKPAWYAISFLNQLGSSLLSKGEGYIATRHVNGDISILLYHFAFTQREKTLLDTVSLQRNYKDLRFSDERPKKICLSVQNLPTAGEYCVRTQILNRRHGCVLDEWANFQFDSQLNRPDIRYLEATSTPEIRQEIHTVQHVRNQLRIQQSLETNELCLIHITLR